MKKLLLMMILITLDMHAICIMIPRADGSTSVEIDDKYYDWSSLSIGEKASCKRDRITRKNQEIKMEQQEKIKQEKSDIYSTCIITTNSNGSKAVIIGDVYQDWSGLTDNEKASCLKDNTAREKEIEKEIEKEQQKKIKQEKSDEHYTCIMFALYNNYWVAEIDGKYYEFSSLTDYEKASCQKDKIAREKEIKNEHQSNTDKAPQEKRGGIIWFIIVIIFGFFIYHLNFRT